MESAIFYSLRPDHFEWVLCQAADFGGKRSAANGVGIPGHECCWQSIPGSQHGGPKSHVLHLSCIKLHHRPIASAEACSMSQGNYVFR